MHWRCNCRFLQVVLSDFALVPLLVGQTAPQGVAAVLSEVWGGEETLIVISSDLSHYLPYDQAQRVDRVTANRICSLDETIDTYRACSAAALAGLLHEAHEREMRMHLLDLRNSGDTAGDRMRVVGYGAFALTQGEGADAG